MFVVIPSIQYEDCLHLNECFRYVPLFGRRQYKLESERESIPFEEQVKVRTVAPFTDFCSCILSTLTMCHKPSTVCFL